MNNIKKIYISIATVAVIGCNFSCSCFADNTITDSVNEAKHNYLEETVITDKTPVLADYIANSRKKIKNNWYPPTSSFENTATIVVTLNKDGKLIDCTVAVPSNDKGFDDSLVKAVKKTKFAPLPEEVNEEFVDLDFTFNMQKRHVEK